MTLQYFNFNIFQHLASLGNELIAVVCDWRIWKSRDSRLLLLAEPSRTGAGHDTVVAILDSDLSLTIIGGNFVWITWQKEGSDRRYSRGPITSVKTLKAYISYNKAKNPLNFDAKWKLLFSSFQKGSWMLILTQYWQSYGLEKVQNLNLKNAQNESVSEKFFSCSWPFSVH